MIEADIRMDLHRLKRSILIVACGLGLGGYAGLCIFKADFAALATPAQMPQKGGKFPHGQAGKQSLKGHRDLGCADCHLIGLQPPYQVTGKPSPNVNPAVATPFPGHASCVACHNFALMSFAKPAFCGVCHERNAESPTQPGVFDRFQTARLASDFGIAFSHVAHKQALPSGLTLAPVNDRTSSLAKAQLQSGSAPLCTDCHAKLQTSFAQFKADQPELAVETGHPTCFTCHLQKPVSQTTQSGKDFPTSGNCQACHSLSDSSGQKLRAPGLFQHFKVAEFRHLDHELDTRSVKKNVASVVKAPDSLCAECHSVVAQAVRLNDIQAPGLGSCTSCHNDKRRPGLPEPLTAAVLRTLRSND
ncbi:MAG: hypothetical protein HYR56_27340 [Acidobacteria bacterium]|nr:hypothetical protein [Acidobacteriota bacterium]MBI3423360.1 hypothetical protein [Acidobacteriota bacterium]